MSIEPDNEKGRIRIIYLFCAFLIQHEVELKEMGQPMWVSATIHSPSPSPTLNLCFSKSE